MASKFRYVADVAQAKALIAAGADRRGRAVRERLHRPRRHDAAAGTPTRTIAGGGVLIDNGTHSVDITRYCLGALAEVQAMEGHRIQDLPVEDTAKMFVRSRAGVLGSIDLSWSVSKELPYFIAVYGRSGAMLVGWRESKYRRAGDRSGRCSAGYDKVDAFQRQIENFAGAVRGEEPLVVTPDDALASVQVIEAAYRSLARGSLGADRRTGENGSSPSSCGAMLHQRMTALMIRTLAVDIYHRTMPNSPLASIPPPSSKTASRSAPARACGTTSTSATAPRSATSASSARRRTSPTTCRSATA